MSRRVPTAAVAVALSALFMACGSQTMPAARPLDTTELALPTEPPFTLPVVDDTAAADGAAAPPRPAGDDTTVDASATQDITASAAWTDVTGNLVGLESECGNVAAVATHPDTDLVVAGIALRGLWLLAPESNGWLPLGTTPGSDRIDNRMGLIAFDPQDPDRFWQSGYYGAGVFETTDNGASFRQLGDVIHVDVVSVDMTDPARSTLLAGGHEQTVLYLSDDGGESWTDIAPAIPSGAGFTSNPFVLDADTFLVGTNSGDAPGIFRSTDGGASWSRIVDVAVHGTPVVTDGRMAWLAVDGALLVSEDGGRTFTTSGAGTGGRRPSLVLLPDDRLAAVGESTIVVSDDWGESWQAIGPELPYSPFGMTFSAARSTFYIWFFTCNAPELGNPVPERGIMQLEVEFAD